MLIKPKFRAGFGQKIGLYKKINNDSKRKTIVIHAVSVGEVIAVEKFIKTLRENFKDEKIIIRFNVVNHFSFCFGSSGYITFLW